MRLWDVESGEEKHVLKGHELGVLCVAYSPDGTTLASVVETKNIILWDADIGEKKRVIEAETNGAFSVAFHTTGEVLAIGCNSGEVQLYNVNSGKLLRKFLGHSKRGDGSRFCIGG